MSGLSSLSDAALAALKLQWRKDELEEAERRLAKAQAELDKHMKGKKK